MLDFWIKLLYNSQASRKKRNFLGALKWIFGVFDLVGIAQLVRAPDCGSGGRRFESVYSPHFIYNGM